MAVLGNPVTRPVPLPMGQEPQELIPDEYDPQSMEDQLLDRPDPVDAPVFQPQQVRVADASGQVPMPARAPEKTPEPVQQPEVLEPSPYGLVPKNDSRYKDYQNLLVADVFLQGALPWLQAAADLAAGRINAEDYDKARQEHEIRIEALRTEHQGFVQSAEKAMPFLAGIGLGMFGKGGSALGAGAKAMGTGAAMGAVQGFTSGPPEEPTLSRERLVNAGEQAAISGATSVAGSALARGASKVAGKISAGRTPPPDDSAARAAAFKKEGAARKRAQTKRENEQTKQYASQYAQYSKMPRKKDLNSNWQDNRKAFAQDPVGAFSKQAAHTPTMEGFSKAVNMPPSVIVQRMIPRLDQIKPKTLGERHLYDEMKAVYNSRAAHMKLGGGVSDDVPGDKTPKAPTAKESKPQKTKAPMTEKEFKKWRDTPEGKDARAETRYQTAKKQADADAQAVKDLRNPPPMKSVLKGRTGKPNTLRLKDDKDGRSVSVSTRPERSRQFDKSKPGRSNRFD